MLLEELYTSDLRGVKGKVNGNFQTDLAIAVLKPQHPGWFGLTVVFTLCRSESHNQGQRGKITSETGGGLIF